MNSVKNPAYLFNHLARHVANVLQLLQIHDGSTVPQKGTSHSVDFFLVSALV
jgi:hypothetical protein